MRCLHSAAFDPTPIGKHADQAWCGYISVRVLKPTDTSPLIERFAKPSGAPAFARPQDGLPREPRTRLNARMAPSRPAWPTATADIASALQAAFTGRLTIDLPELSELIPMHRHTIARHIKAGHLTGRIKGLGRTKRHRVFTIVDVASFLQLLAEPPQVATLDTKKPLAIRQGFSAVKTNITRPKKRPKPRPP